MVMKWIAKVKEKLSATSSFLKKRLSSILSNKKIDKNTLEEIEDLLISSDLGFETANKLVTEISTKKFGEKITSEEVLKIIGEELHSLIKGKNKKLTLIDKELNVIVFCGVNGSGKTTTIGKLAHKFHKEGKKVVIAACDTFRAAAQEQLEVWANRAKSECVCGEINSDPSSIAYKAINIALEKKADVLLIDTAGRLHNKINLMQQLEKLFRVIKKQNEKYPTETILVLDGTTGSNSLLQVEEFSKIAPITGLIVTKLDGTAKAGMMIPILAQYDIPGVAICLGESVTDIADFDPKEFVDNIVS